MREVDAEEARRDEVLEGCHTVAWSQAL